MRRALTRQGTVRRELTAVTVNGTNRSVELIYVAAGDDAVLALALDISGRVRAEQRLRQTENRFRGLVSAANEGIWLADPDGRATFVNARAARMLGIPAEDIVGRPLTDFVADPGSATGLWQIDDDVVTTARRELRLVRSDGSRIDVIASTSALHDDAGEVCGLVALLSDVTQLKRDARTQALVFEHSPAAMVRVDRSGRIRAVNPAMCELTGRGATELNGKPVVSILVALAGEQSPWETEDLGESATSGPRHIVRSDGGTVGASVTFIAVRDELGAAVEWVCQCLPAPSAVAAPLNAERRLSYRERQVLTLLAKGLDGPAIAERLGLASETVRAYTQSAREKTGAKTRTEAVVRAVIHGEITL
jgi:PAS domain S-box-containing protein